MKIKAIFKANNFGKIWINGKDYQSASFFQETTHELSVKNSEIYDELSNYLDINGMNYAYLIHYFIRYSLVIFHHPALETIMNYIKILDRFVKEDVELEVDDYYGDTFVKCAKLVCKKKNVKLKIISAKTTKKSILFHEFFILGSNLAMFVRYSIGLLRRIFNRTDYNKKKILFLANLRFANPDCRKNKMFGRIIRKLPKDSFKVLRYNRIDSPSQILEFLKKYFWKKESYIGDYATLNHFNDCRIELKKIRALWKSLPKKKLKKLCMYKGYNFYLILKPRLDALFNRLIYIGVDAAKISEKIKAKEKYSILMIDHEENMYGKALTMGKKRKTYALSHELIYPGCVHTHIKTKNKRLLPDLKFVWGPYSKRVLIDDCSYPEKIIKITGSPKFDALLKQKFNLKRIISKYKLSKKDKILYTTSKIDNDGLKAIREIAELNPSYEIILKPHPNSDELPIREFLANRPNNLTLMKKTDDTYELMAVSKYLIHEASTSGFEAMLMGKIVFSLNLTEKPYSALPYGKAQITCHSPLDFSKKLQNLKEVEVREKIADFITEMHPNRKGDASRIIAEYCTKSF